MNRCSTCKELIFDFERKRHKCKPVWLVWHPSQGQEEEDATKVHAIDAEDAAETWAEDDDAMSADYTIIGGEPATVFVKSESGETTKWVVSGETIPSYSARKVTDA